VVWKKDFWGFTNSKQSQKEQSIIASLGIRTLNFLWNSEFRIFPKNTIALTKKLKYQNLLPNS
jgi:hypothetical protein